MMLVFLIVLASVAGLLALAAAIANLAGMRVPPLVFAVGLLTPAVIGVVSARVNGAEAVQAGIDEGIWGWLGRAAGELVGAWSVAGWAFATVAGCCVAVLLLSAIAGIARGPRRWGLFGLGLGWTALLSVGGLVSIGVGGGASTGWLVWSSLPVFGFLASFSLCAGGPKSGAEAAGLGTLSAAVGMVCLAGWALVGEDATALLAVAASPSTDGMWSAARATRAPMALLALIAAVGGAGFIALGAAAGRKPGGPALVSLVAGVGLPALVMMTTVGPVVRAGTAQVATLPMAAPDSSIRLPFGPRGWYIAPGAPALQVDSEGYTWIFGEVRDRVPVSAVAPVRDLRARLDAEWPAPAPAPVLFVDAGASADQARIAIDGVIRGPEPVRVGVRYADRAEDLHYWSVRYPDDASDPVITLNPSMALMAGCQGGLCSVEAVEGLLDGHPDLKLRGTGGLHVHPDTPWGLVTATAAAVDEQGVRDVPIVFLARGTIEPVEPE